MTAAVLFTHFSHIYETDGKEAAGLRIQPAKQREMKLRKTSVDSPKKLTYS